MDLDNESWLIDIGDEIVEKKAETGTKALTVIEYAIYCLWVIDYAVRNSGSLETLADIYPAAIEELSRVSNINGWLLNAKVGLDAADSDTFFDSYYDLFDLKCSELRVAYESDQPVG